MRFFSLSYGAVSVDHQSWSRATLRGRVVPHAQRRSRRRRIMKKSLVFGLLLAAVGASGLWAQTPGVNGPPFICTIEDSPAATLLLPYFEVDLNSADGINTLFSINNASATAILAHVVLWSDLSVPTFDFNIYLTGYDVQTV